MTNDNIKIIAFSGKKQSGKSTSAQYLSDRLSYDFTVQHLNFASEIKRIVYNCFYDNEEVSASTIFGTDFLESEKTKSMTLQCGKTVREVLQLIGTDWFRNLDSKCWIRAYMKSSRLWQLKNTGSPILILTADVRFPNEVKCIQELSGHVIRLLRQPFDDNHESEVALNAMESRSQIEFVDKCDLHFDAIIDNRDMTLEQKNDAVWQLINEKGWT